MVAVGIFNTDQVVEKSMVITIITVANLIHMNINISSVKCEYWGEYFILDPR